MPSVPPRVLASLLAFVPFVARAVTTLTVSHSGYLVDASDVPVSSASLALTFRLVDQQSGGNVVWTGSCSVPVRSGYFTVRLGADCGPALTDAHLPLAASRWVELTVGAVTLSPRHLIAATPAAALSQRALDADTLGGQAPSAFAAAAHAHAAGDVTGFASAAVAAVTASGAFALESHSHALANATTAGFLSASDWSSFKAKLSAEADPKIGTLAAGKWCTSDGTQIHCASSEPAGGTGGSGGQPNAGAAPGTCNSSAAGFLWYDTVASALKMCNGFQYVSVSSVSPPPAAPATPTAQAANGQVSLSWSAVANATSYDVAYQEGTGITASATIVAVPSGTTSLVTGLTNGTQYAFAVRTIAAGWTSGWSTVVLATPSPRYIAQVGGVWQYSDGVFPATCHAYLTGGLYSGQGSGAYKLQLSNGTTPVTWCDMTTDTGGWTLVFQDTTANSDNATKNYMARTSTAIGTWGNDKFKISAQHVAHTKVMFKGIPDSLPSGYVNAWAIINSTLDLITGTNDSACGPRQFDNNGCEMNGGTLDFYSYTGSSFAAPGYWFGDTGPAPVIYTEYNGYRYLWHTSTRSSSQNGSSPTRVVRQVLVR